MDSVGGKLDLRKIFTIFPVLKPTESNSLLKCCSTISSGSIGRLRGKNHIQ